jgi:DNA adenine methylase
MKLTKPLIRQTTEKLAIKNWILEQFPEGYEDMTYCEPFGGCANLLFHKNKSKIEIYNDKDDSLVNLLRAVRDEPRELSRRLSLYRHSQETFDRLQKKKHFEDYLEFAVNDFALRKMSKNQQKREFQKLRSGESWKEYVATIGQHSQRIRESFLYAKEAIEIINSINFSSSLLYCDPPYLHENKTTKHVYTSEMTPENHMELCRVLDDFSGKVVLSGCASPLYRRLYKNWNIVRKKVNKEVGDKKMEIIWKNF